MILILLAIAALIGVLLVRTWLAKAKARKLGAPLPGPDPQELEIHGKGLQAFIQCPTVSHKDSYDDTPFAQLRETARKQFPLLHEKAQLMIFSQDCWIYKLPGKDPGRSIMLMSHHDVVEANESWTYPPFSGTIAGGKLYGRGTVDTKSPLYAQMAALEALLAEGFQPACNVYIGSSHNEETCGDGIPLALAYFKEQGITFEVVLDEGGAVIDPPLGGMQCEKCAMVAVHEKGRVKLRCTASAATSHTSLNGAGAAGVIERMGAFIQDIHTGNHFVRRLNPQVKAMFQGLGPYCAFPMQVLFANLWLFGGLLTKALPKISAQAGNMIGTNCVFNKIEGESLKNECSCVVMLRSVDAGDLEKDLAAFRRTADKYGITVEILPESEYHGPADMTQPAFRYTMDCIAKHFPAYPAAPFILPAGSDARHLTDVCKCVLRFAPICLSGKQLSSVHAVDENIDISAVCEAVVFYRDFVEEYR